MSETELHRHLIESLTRMLKSMHSDMNLIAELQKYPRQPTTPIIEGYRPDVFGQCSIGNQCLIGEAKTTKDALQSSHADSQIGAFLSFLEKQRNPIFFLATPGEHADLARSKLRFFETRYSVNRTRLFVFDSHDVWELVETDGASWLLH